MTVLSIKVARMPERLELIDQFLEAQAEWHMLKLDADEEFQELADVNLEAWDIVEMIYEDFRDPVYGTPCWALYGDARSQEKAENTVKNCRRAHELNMERIRLKNAINAKAGADQEVKSW
jgi:hypothetical protein